MTKGEAFEKFEKRIKEAEAKLGQAYRHYYTERKEAEEELQTELLAIHFWGINEKAKR